MPGVNDILNGYTKADGTKELSLQEKIERGKKAISAMKTYRSGDKSAAVRKTIQDNMPYFGYGYVKSADQIVPYIPLTFWSFRIMVGLGIVFILFFIVALFFVYKKDIAKQRWLLVSAIVLVPLAYIASELGWVVAELGRQPWTIQDILPTWAAVSDLQPGSVILTFFIFLVLFTAMLGIEINILCKQIKKGPEHTDIEQIVNN